MRKSYLDKNTNYVIMYRMQTLYMASAESLSEPKSDGIPSHLLYDTITNSLGAVSRLGGHTITASGMELVPEGPFLLVSTHRGFKDIPAIGVSLKKEYGRRVQFWAKEELFKNKFVGKVLEQCGTIPINRQKPKDAQISRAVSVLEGSGHNRILCLFSEGTRKTGPEVNDHKTFFPLISGITGVPIVVGAVAGSEFQSSSPIPLSNLHFHIGGVIEPPDEKIVKPDGVSYLRLGVKNRDYIEETAETTRILMVDSLNEAHLLLR
jgi:1-acyl-sn-glycerol-3-phosphate acyltransferase